jgi:hypothetical protein
VTCNARWPYCISSLRTQTCLHLLDWTHHELCLARVQLSSRRLCQSVGSPIVLLIIPVEAIIATIKGNICIIILRKSARPSVTDSMISGKTKEANIPAAKMAALVVMSFFFSDLFIVLTFRQCLMCQDCAISILDTKRQGSASPRGVNATPVKSADGGLRLHPIVIGD